MVKRTMNESSSPRKRAPVFGSRISLRIALHFLVVAMLTCLSFLASPTSHLQVAHAFASKISPTPPMGWSTWNAYGHNIDPSVIKAATDAIVKSGMKKAGYQYVNIDDGWWTGSRDANGNITIDTSKWPGGMQAITSYIHSKGLKAGIYTDAGSNGCGGAQRGSYGHYKQDFLQFEQWNFDYVKVDWCGSWSMPLDPPTQYGQIRDAIASATAQTGHPMVFSICDWGVGNPWNWGPTTGSLWRTSNDINASWNSVLHNFDIATSHPTAQGPGGYNDPDMLEVGAPGLSDTESQTHFSLWAIAGAPLIAGNDVTTMSETIKNILTNREVIAVDQDPLGLQGMKVSEPTPGLQVWSKVLKTPGQRAVVLLNRNSSPASITVNWRDLGLATGPAQVRDLWAHANLGSHANSYTASVQPHGVVMLKISGREGPQTTYQPDRGNSPLQFSNVQASTSGPQVMTVFYLDTHKVNGYRTALLNINDEKQTINIPVSGHKTSPTVRWMKVIVDLQAGKNTLKFSNNTAKAINLEKISLPTTHAS
jgi:hypothetical protein